MRKPDWLPSLKSILRAYDGQQFIFGESDCLHFAADCIRAVTGDDVLGPLRNAYAGRLGAARKLDALGHGSVKSLAGGLLDPRYEAIPPDCAAPGDVGVTDTDALCVYSFGTWMARGSDGSFVEVRPVRVWAVV